MKKIFACVILAVIALLSARRPRATQGRLWVLPRRGGAWPLPGRPVMATTRAGSTSARTFLGWDVGWGPGWWGPSYYRYSPPVHHDSSSLSNSAGAPAAVLVYCQSPQAIIPMCSKCPEAGRRCSNAARRPSRIRKRG